MEEKNIPEMRMEGNKVVLTEIVIPIKINGELKEVKMRKLPSGIRNQIKKKYAKTSHNGREPTIDIDEGGYQEETLHKAIIEAPFDTSLDAIKELPSEITDYLFLEYVEMAEPSEKKNVE
jgi:hypothetical protein